MFFCVAVGLESCFGSCSSRHFTNGFRIEKEIEKDVWTACVLKTSIRDHHASLRPHTFQTFPQHVLYFLLEPQGHLSFLPTLLDAGVLPLGVLLPLGAPPSPDGVSTAAKSGTRGLSLIAMDMGVRPCGSAIFTSPPCSTNHFNMATALFLVSASVPGRTITMSCAATQPKRFCLLMFAPAFRSICAYSVSVYGFVLIACMRAVVPDRSAPSTATLASVMRTWPALGISPFAVVACIET